MDSRSPAIAAAFLNQFLADRAQGVTVGLTTYQARFPGFEDVIAEEYALAARDAGDDRQVGRFVLGRSLGSGGQGLVYEAYDPTLRRHVALKVLTGFGEHCTDVLARFRREAEVSSRLDHPDICTVYEAELEGNLPYIAMQLVEGQTLSAKLARGRRGEEATPDPVLPLPPRNREDLVKLLRFFSRVARALDAAHRVGVVHRDVKPGNLMVQPDGAPVVLDFGLASAVEGGSPSITLTGDVFGTPAYMAPEQIEADGAAITPATDVHALAVCLFECLTLILPFAGHSRQSLFREVLTRDPIDLAQLRPDLPRDLGVVLTKAMQKDPRHRYASAADFAADLLAVAELRPIAARPTPSAVRMLRWCRREPGKARLIGLVLLSVVLALASFGYLAARWRDFQQASAEREARSLRQQVENALERGFFELEELHFHAAQERFAEVAQLTDGVNVEAVIGGVLARLRDDRDQDALELLEQDGRDLPALRRLKAAVYEQLGDTERSRAILADLGPPQGDLDLLVQALWVMTGNAEDPVEQGQEALGLMNRVVFLADRPRAIYHLERARAAALAVDGAAERESAEALYRHWSDNPVVLAQLASASLYSDPEEALRYARQCVEVLPEYPAGWFLVSRALVETGDAEGAIEAADRAMALRPDYPGAHVARAHAVLLMGDVELADRSVDMALRLAPNLDHALYLRGVIRMRQGRFEEALALLRRAPRVIGEHAKLMVNIAECLYGLGRLPEAEESFEEAARMAPDLKSAHNGLAIVKARRGDLDGAIAAFRRTVELAPADALVHRNLGTALVQAGRWEELRAELSRWLDGHPDSVPHWIELAKTYLAPSVPEDLRDPAAARRYAERALECWEATEDGDPDVRDAIDALLRQVDGA